MKRDLFLWQFGGFAFTSLAGTLLHFLYDWSGKSLLVAPFSGINESTWEHMKLLYFPLLIFGFLQWFFFREFDDFWWIKLIGGATGLLLIPILFYGYNGAFGPSPDWLNISIFFIAAAAVFLLEGYLFLRNFPPLTHQWIALLLLLLIGGAFIFFTFAPPDLPIFKNPKQ